MRTIKWECTTEPHWEWLGGNPDGGERPGIPPSPSLQGTIKLPDNKDYWYTCADLILQGVAFAYVYVRYFNDGEDQLQAAAMAKDKWTEYGNKSTQSSVAKHGGITIIATFA